MFAPGHVVKGMLFDSTTVQIKAVKQALLYISFYLFICWNTKPQKPCIAFLIKFLHKLELLKKKKNTWSSLRSLSLLWQGGLLKCLFGSQCVQAFIVSALSDINFKGHWTSWSLWKKLRCVPWTLPQQFLHYVRGTLLCWEGSAADKSLIQGVELRWEGCMELCLQEYQDPRLPTRTLHSKQAIKWSMFFHISHCCFSHSWL